MDPHQVPFRPTPPPATLLLATEVRSRPSQLGSHPDTLPRTHQATHTTAHPTHPRIHHATAQLQATPQVQATPQPPLEEHQHSTLPPMPPPTLPQDHLPFRTLRFQGTQPPTLVCHRMRQGRGQDTLGLEVVGETLQKVTLLKVETLQRKGVILLATLPPTLQGAEILQATPRHTLQAILPGAKDSPLKDVETLQQEHRQEETVLLATLQHTPQAELILQATLQRTHQRV